MVRARPRWLAPAHCCPVLSFLCPRPVSGQITRGTNSGPEITAKQPLRPVLALGLCLLLSPGLLHPLTDWAGGARVMKAFRREDTCVHGKGWQGWHELFPSVTVRTWEAGPGYPAMLGPGGGAVGEEGSLPSSDQETEMSHHLGLQQKPLKGCFRVRTLGPNPFPYPLSP